jgi:hypothetical protein
MCLHGGCRRAGERAVSFLFYRNSSIIVCDGAHLPVTIESKGGASYERQLECREVIRYIWVPPEVEPKMTNRAEPSRYSGVSLTGYNYAAECRTTRAGYESLKALQGPN